MTEAIPTTPTKSLSKIPVSVMADFYKITHRIFYPENTTEIYSTWIPRSSSHFPVPTDYAVAFGFQAFVQQYLVDLFQTEFFARPKAEVVAEYVYVIKNTLGGEVDSSHIEALHDLGYLPLEIKALPEGTRVPMKVPTLTIQNTLPEFFWLTNYFETLMSSELWLPSNSATIAAHYREIMNKWAIETTGSIAGVDFQGHDFSFRGMQGLSSSVLSGLGHLLSFTGTDNIPAIVGAEMYYHTRLDEELVGTSVPATEHSIMSSYGRDELTAFETIIDSVPEGIVSIVSDTYDFWNVLQNIIPALKEKIMERNGKVVLRPDSGNPADIICGTMKYDLIINPHRGETIVDYREEVLEVINEKPYDFGPNRRAEFALGFGKFKKESVLLHVKFGEVLYAVPYYYENKKTINILNNEISIVEETPEQKGAIQLLWETFGGTVNAKDKKELDQHIGLLYGDAISLSTIGDIFQRLSNKGFASTNIVVGIGSFSYTFNTRDSLGYALKATYAKIDGKETFIQKDPATDKENLKKSLTGKVAVKQMEDGTLVAVDHLNDEQEAAFEGNLLQPIFKDGQMLNVQTLAQVKQQLHG